MYIHIRYVYETTFTNGVFKQSYMSVTFLVVKRLLNCVFFKYKKEILRTKIFNFYITLFCAEQWQVIPLIEVLYKTYHITLIKLFAWFCVINKKKVVFRYRN